MIELTAENTQNAVKRCKQLKPRVKYLAPRTYQVFSANNSNAYTVRFDVKNGKRLGKCECKASERNLICYHLIAGATTNIYRRTLELSKTNH